MPNGIIRLQWRGLGAVIRRLRAAIDRAVRRPPAAGRAARLHPAPGVHAALLRGAELSTAAGLSELSAARLHGADGVPGARWCATRLSAAALSRPDRVRHAVVSTTAAVRGTAIRNAACASWLRDAAWIWPAAERLSIARILGLRAAGPEDEPDGDSVVSRFVHRVSLLVWLDSGDRAWHRCTEPNQAIP